ncbi:MAG: 30S ribosomal protein S4 [Candidatus Omnitrophica bacterium ADurb.Bin277]|nr:MAG: 30S ribosomal protein S4 [Candidatus Omnitrophica bacterium ADurb.Bin277]
MSRYRGPVIKLHRREGVNLGLKGRRTTDEKHDKRLTNPPGQHGAQRSKLSDYGVQLREKQKMKRIYGLGERQFRIFFQRAAQKRGVTGEILIQQLERRLDNVVYRLLFSTSRREARQMVSHGLVTVNGQKVDIPSYQVKVNDKISVQAKEATQKRVQASLEKWKDLSVPEWLELDREKLTGSVLRLPVKSDAGLPVEESLIVELYSK